MIEVRFASWWKHSKVVLLRKEHHPPSWYTRGGLAGLGALSGRRDVPEEAEGLFLVGHGTPELVDVFADEPLQLPNPRERRGRNSRRSWRARWTHALAFASIETPQQALLFAQRYGLLGLHRRPHSSGARTRSDFEIDLLTLLIHRQDFIVREQAILDHEWPGWREKPPTDKTALRRIEELAKWEAETKVLTRRLEEYRATWSPPIFEVDMSPPKIPDETVADWLLLAADLRSVLESASTGEAERATEQLDLYTLNVLDDAPRLSMLGGQPRFTYNRLASAIFTQAALDLTNVERFPVRCEGPGCGLWFIPTHPSALYCSEECRRSAQNRRSYEDLKRRKKRKEAKRDAKGSTRTR